MEGNLDDEYRDEEGGEEGNGWRGMSFGAGRRAQEVEARRVTRAAMVDLVVNDWWEHISTCRLGYNQPS